MANPILIATDLSTYTFSGSGGAATGYPYTNLNNYINSSLWRSNTTAQNQTLVVDFGVATSCNTVVVGNHNWSSLGLSALIIYAADDAGFSVNLVTQSMSVPLYNSDIYFTWAGFNKRYWAIYFGKGSPLSVAPQAGNLWLDNGIPFTQPYEFGAKKDTYAYETVEKTTLSGLVRTSQNFTGRLVWELTFKMQSDSFRTVFWTAFSAKTRGKMLPFYFLDVDGGTLRYLKLDSDYNPLAITRYNNNDLITLTMRMPEPL